VQSHTPAQYWWVLAIAAAFSFLAGIIVLAEPKNSLEALAVVLGIYLVVIGISGFVSALQDPGLTGGVRILAVVMAGLTVVIGIIAILRPDSSVKFVAVLFGIYLIISGIRYLILAALLPVDRGVTLIHGLLDLIFGIVVVVWPKIGLGTLAVILGICLLFGGIVQLWAALALRRANTATT
jgi:uncharacterized membrane protein HdeD (DUF308 family)